MSDKHSTQHLVRPGVMAGGFIFLVIVMAAAFGYGYYEFTKLSSQVTSLDDELTTTIEILKNNLQDATTTLALTLHEETQRVRDQVGDISRDVNDLEKLTKTDPELLAKYSKIFFLSDNYEPARLVEVPDKYRYSDNQLLQVIPEVLPPLRRMIDEAKDDGIELYVLSAYRSFRSQGALKGQYSVTYGAGTANQFSADQGYSEHQLGTAVDLITTGTGGQLYGFESTLAYEWMLNNAHRFGFTLSYPQNNGYYIFEPWHWRFVGENSPMTSTKMTSFSTSSTNAPLINI
jgi:LAS superfamily LD-carboxypeptidase LdcB